jgi:glycosyltransferase involved in cell wall biosynthesis
MLLETLASIESVRIDSLAEVIIVNDGSTDPVTCRIFQELDSTKYTIIHQENRGLSGARNAGIEVARGEFILPVDSDNLIRQAYLDQGPTILNAKPEVGVVYGDREFFGELTGRSRTEQFDWRYMVKGNGIDACALYRKSVWQSVGGYDEKMRIGWEDWDFWLRAALRGWKFFHLDEIAFDYRVRTGSMLSDTNQHQPALREYIYGKPGHEIFRLLRDQSDQLDELSSKLKSRAWDYRIGSAILRPLRAIKRAFGAPGPRKIDELVTRLRRKADLLRDYITTLRYRVDRNAIRMTVQTIKELPDRQPTNARWLVLFAHYDPQDEVDDYVRFYLEKLCELGATIIFVSGSPNLKPEAAARIAPLCAAIYTRNSLSLDFGSWNLAWQQMKAKGWKLSGFEKCIFANDSVYGPLFDLSEMFSQFVEADMFGVTENTQVFGKNGEAYPHLQSYFLAWNIQPSTHKFIEDFWNDFRYVVKKDRLIAQYEIGLSRRARGRGLRIKAYIPNAVARSAAEKDQEHECRELIKEKNVDNTIFLWYTIISCLRCPFLKTAVPRRNPYGSAKVHELSAFLNTWTDYNPQLIIRNLERLGLRQRPASAQGPRGSESSSNA